MTIGCVDNRVARSALGHVSRSWLIDAGNGENYGQVLVGNASLERLRGGLSVFDGRVNRRVKAFDEASEVCHLLPLPTLQQPRLLAVDPVRSEDCAVAVALGGQSPSINPAMAVLVVEMVRKLVAATLSWMGAYLDLDAGSLHPVYATPDAVSRLVGIRKSVLLDQVPKSRTLAEVFQG